MKSNLVHLVLLQNKVKLDINKTSPSISCNDAFIFQSAQSRHFNGGNFFIILAIFS
ncbi:hypothetical protein J6T66_06240 [bacterium]|nr:hypothetical protein [bacterium]